MANITRRGRKWTVRWYEGGRQRERTCPNKRTASLLKAEVERAKALGQRWCPENAQEVIDMKELLACYLEFQEVHLAESSVKAVDHAMVMWVRYLTERYPRQELTADFFTQANLLGFYKFLVKDKGNALQTSKKRVQQVQHAWSWLAIDCEAHRDQMPRPVKIKMRKPLRRTVEAPTWEEMDACIEAANGWHKQLAIMLRSTGLRVHQAMNLRMDDLDRESLRLRLRPELGKSDHERSGRTIPVPDHFLKEVLSWERSDDWLVPCNRKNGNRKARSRDMQRAWKRSGVRQEVWGGAPGHHGRPHHSFRKGYVSGLCHLGANPDSVEVLVGHKLDGLRSTYTAIQALHLREAVGLVPPIGGYQDVPSAAKPIEPNESASNVIQFPARNAS